MSSKDQDNKNYTDDFMKWQKNQYQPGVYTGGNLPPDIKYGGKKAGYTVLVQGVVILFFGLIMYFQTEFKIPSYFMIIFGAILCYAGWNKIRRSKRK